MPESDIKILTHLRRRTRTLLFHVTMIRSVLEFLSNGIRKGCHYKYRFGGDSLFLSVLKISLVHDFGGFVR